MMSFVLDEHSHNVKRKHLYNLIQDSRNVIMMLFELEEGSQCSKNTFLEHYFWNVLRECFCNGIIKLCENNIHGMS